MHNQSCWDLELKPIIILRDSHLLAEPKVEANPALPKISLTDLNSLECMNSLDFYLELW